MPDESLSFTLIRGLKSKLVMEVDIQTTLAISHHHRVAVIQRLGRDPLQMVTVLHLFAFFQNNGKGPQAFRYVNVVIHNRAPVSAQGIHFHSNQSPVEIQRCTF